MDFNLPYGNGYQRISIPNTYSIEVVSGEKKMDIPSLKVLAENAFSHPIKSASLYEIAHRGESVVIVTDDHTRPCPSKEILPYVLKELEKSGVSSTDITILIATGTHKPPSQNQIIELLGKEIVHEYNIVSNDNNHSEYISIGRSSFKHDIMIHKSYVNADVKIIVSDIEYHYFAGFGGTRKSILPGIASGKTIQENHAMMFNDYARTGELKRNPVAIEMQEAYEMIGCDFCVGAILNPNHDIVGLWTGDAMEVMGRGVDLVKRLYEKKVRRKPDVIFTAADGNPHDINLYQSLKAVHTASKVIKKDGSIVLTAECKEGLGNSTYQRWLEQYSSTKEIKLNLKKHFQIGAHKAFYHREVLDCCKVYLKSSLHPSFVQKSLGFKPVTHLQQTVNNILSKNKAIEHILIVPQGSTTYLCQ